MIEALSELGNRVRPLTARGDSQCGQGHKGGQGMPSASGAARIGQASASELPKGAHRLGRDRRWGRRGRLSIAQLRCQFDGLKLSQGSGNERAHPKLLGMLLVNVEILTITPKPFGGT